MAQGNDNRNDVVSSQSLMEETTNTQRQRLVAGTLTCPPRELPTLPFDLLPEILCRLQVKLLVQLRCVCKFFNSLISDPSFAKKHLQSSTKRHHLMLTNGYADEIGMYESPIPSVFSTSTVFTQTQLYPPNGNSYAFKMSSSDGIFCGFHKPGSYFVWNPSIRKFKLLPPLENDKCWTSISFGYDHFIHNYKVIAVSDENKVCAYTLGTDYWTRIDNIPYSESICGPGVFVSDYWTVNLFASNVILSLHLENESYQKLCLPDFKNESNSWSLGVLRDCLCIFARSYMFLDVWIMNEYGNEKSWTKLYTVPNLKDQYLEAIRALYIYEDDQLLVECYELHTGNIKLVIYDPKTGTSNIPEFQNNYEHTDAVVYIESLISP